MHWRQIRTHSEHIRGIHISHIYTSDKCIFKAIYTSAYLRAYALEADKDT